MTAASYEFDSVLPLRPCSDDLGDSIPEMTSAPSFS